MATDPQIILPLISAASALLGAAIGSCVTLGVAWITKRSDERKHFRDLVVRAAIENYKEERSMARLVAEREPHRPIRLYPLDDFILGMARLAEVIDKKLSPEELRQELVKLDEYRKIAQEHWNSQVKPKSSA